MPDALLRNLPFLVKGFLLTLRMAFWTALFGTTLALPLALLRHYRVLVAWRACALYVGVIRGTPVLVVLLVCYFALPALFGYRTTATAASVLAFSVFIAAYCAEDMRAGLRAVPPSLQEAGRALGLKRRHVLRLIVLPLAARVAIPTLFGQYVRMVKYTSVASVIGVNELMGSGVLLNGKIFQPLPILAAIAAAYLVVCLTVSLIGRAVQHRLDLPLRRAG